MLCRIPGGRNRDEEVSGLDEALRGDIDLKFDV